MFNFRSFLKLSAAAAAALIVVSCGEEKPVLASKGNMIPDNAMMAVKIDANQLFEKALGDQNSQGRELWNMGKSMLSMSLGEVGEIGNVARNILKDPATLGVNMNEPVVMSLSADMSKAMLTNEASVDMYFVALLDNKEAFLQVMDATVTFAEREEGLKVTKDASDKFTHYVFVDETEGSLDLGVSAESVVVRFRYRDNDKTDLKTSMLGLFANAGPAATEGLDVFYASAGELTLWYNIEAIMSMVEPMMAYVDQDTAAQFKQILPMLKGASMVADLAFLDGQTVLDMKVFGSEEMTELSKKFYEPASDKFFSYMPGTSVIVGNYYVKNLNEYVKWLSKMDKNYASLFEQLEYMYGIDERFFEGISGNLTFAIDGNGIDTNEVPGFVFMLECDRHVWDFMVSELSEYATYVGSDMYNLMNVAYVSYDNGHVVFADAKTMNAGPLGGSNSFAENALAKQIEKGGLTINMETLPYYLLYQFAAEIDRSMTGGELLEYVSSVTVSTYDNMSGKLIVEMGDKEHNLLEKLVLEAIGNLTF